MVLFLLRPSVALALMRNRPFADLAVLRWSKWRKKKSLGSLSSNLFIVFAEVNQTVRQSILFASRIDNDQRRVFLVPLPCDAITPVFVGVIALNEGDGRNLPFFNDR